MPFEEVKDEARPKPLPVSGPGTEANKWVGWPELRARLLVTLILGLSLWKVCDIIVALTNHLHVEWK